MALREHNSALPSRRRPPTRPPNPRASEHSLCGGSPSRAPMLPAEDHSETTRRKNPPRFRSRFEPGNARNPGFHPARPKRAGSHTLAQNHLGPCHQRVSAPIRQGKEKAPSQRRAPAACLLRRQASKRKGPCAVLRPHRDQSGVGVRHALFPVPALGATEGCRLPDAIPRGKAELSAS